MLFRSTTLTAAAAIGAPAAPAAPPAPAAAPPAATPAVPKPVPPPGITISEADRSFFETTLSALAEQVRKLRAKADLAPALDLR